MRKGGFSMLEVLVAISLLLLVIGFLVPALGVVSSKRSRINSKFMQIIESVNLMEKITAASFEGVALYDGYSFLDGKGQVSVSNVSDTLKKIVIFVGEEESPKLKFETLVVDNE